MRIHVACGLAFAVFGISGCGLMGGDDPPASTPVPSEPTTSAPVPSSAAPTPSATSLTWSEAFERFGPAVVRIAITRCSESGASGSGFAIAPDTVVTAAHVVADGRTISVQTPDGQTVSSHPVLISAETDTAVLHLDDPLETSQVFSLADEVPARGSELAVIGYPFGEYELSITNGIVSRLPGPVDYGDQVVERAFTSNAATNGGNSGGPVIDHSGQVIGLVSGGRNWDRDRPVEGVNYMIPVTDIGRSVSAASSLSQSLVVPCDEDVEAPEEAEGSGPTLTVDEDSEIANVVGQLLFTHGQAVNTGSYVAAFELFTQAAQRRLGGLELWSQGLAESSWDEVAIHSVAMSSSGQSATARVTLTTRQPADGSTTECSVWAMAYEISLGDEMLIDKARGRSSPG